MKKPTKIHHICAYLAVHPNSTRHEVLREVQEKLGLPYKSPKSNNSYWQPGGSAQQLQWYPNRSVVREGLVTVTGKRGNFLLYSVTVEGLKLARKAGLI